MLFCAKDGGEGVVLEPEVAVDIASDPAVGANNFLDFLLNEEIVRINVSM
jgi:hypothetical protein